MKTIIIFSIVRIFIMVVLIGSILNIRDTIPVRVEKIDPVLNKEIFQLPSDIMKVKLKDEIWIYRLHKNNQVEKIIIERDI